VDSQVGGTQWYEGARGGPGIFRFGSCRVWSARSCPFFGKRKETKLQNFGEERGEEVVDDKPLDEIIKCSRHRDANGGGFEREVNWKGFEAAGVRA